MSNKIDELFKEVEFDIYNNPDINNEDIERIVKVLCSYRNVDYMKYFDPLKCSSKFCWMNFLRIIEKLPYEEKIKVLPFLFELLQDRNWPTYEKTMQLLESFDKELITSNVKKFLRQAYEENDETWIDNIELLTEKLELDYF